MNIVLITSGRRTELLRQSLASLIQNAANPNEHHLTVVCDGRFVPFEHSMPNSIIVNTTSQGASASRNIGAGSIPKYRRKDRVLFLDDDVFMCRDWDRRMSAVADVHRRAIVSGYSHPYNQYIAKVAHRIDERDEEGSFKLLTEVRYGSPLVISSVAMMMTWGMFDEVGPWDEPGGPGGSEDYALCMRAKDLGFGFAVTDPQCVIHTGLLSSTGQQIVGYKELCEQNDKLLDLHNIRGKVIFE